MSREFCFPCSWNWNYLSPALRERSQ